jgi:hypothetical protein
MIGELYQSDFTVGVLMSFAGRAFGIPILSLYEVASEWMLSDRCTDDELDENLRNLLPNNM